MKANAVMRSMAFPHGLFAVLPVPLAYKRFLLDGPFLSFSTSVHHSKQMFLKLNQRDLTLNIQHLQHVVLALPD